MHIYKRSGTNREDSGGEALGDHRVVNFGYSQLNTLENVVARKVDVRLPGKGNSDSHGSMIK